MACKACRSRKIKCDRARPICRNCRQRSSQCTYAGERRTRRWLEAGMDGRPLSMDGNAQNQPLNETATQGSQQAHGAIASEASVRIEASQLRPRQDADSRPSQTCWPPMETEQISGALTQTTAYDSTDMLLTPTSSNNGRDEILLDRILEGDHMESFDDRNPALWMRVSDGDEYTGPSSGISLVSDLGLSWVRQHVADSDFLCETMQDIRNGILGHLRQPKCVPRDLTTALSTPRTPKDISQAQVMRHVDAYFSSVQVVFPILDRVTFLSQLATMGSNSHESQSYSWRALLNAVLASGCRATLSDETAEAFQISGRQAWDYFQIALSFESRILHSSTDLLAVQAMAVMTVFAQGLSSPQRQEYTLSSIASRLAQSIALNRHPPPEWNLTENEKRERNRVFWVIYCLDSFIALRCGRPTVIHDEDVSCCFPRGVRITQREEGPVGITNQAPFFDFFLCITKLARICGKISRLLYSATALYTPSFRLIPTLNRLLQDLDSWLQLIPAEIKPGKALNRISDTSGLSRDQIIILHTSYYDILCAIYRRASPIFTQDSKSLEHLVDRKSHVSHIEAARCIALLTKHFDIESFTPAWVVFYYPFMALTTIFIHVVSNPPNNLTRSDIALMETVVGFFGRLEYITSGEAAFTKTTEFVRQARNVTDINNKERISSQKVPTPTDYSDLLTSMTMSLQDSIDVGPMEMDIFANGTGINYAEQTSETVMVAQEPLIAHHDQTLYSNLSGLMASSPGDTSNGDWL